MESDKFHVFVINTCIWSLYCSRILKDNNLFFNLRKVTLSKSTKNNSCTTRLTYNLTGEWSSHYYRQMFNSNLNISKWKYILKINIEEMMLGIMCTPISNHNMFVNQSFKVVIGFSFLIFRDQCRIPKDLLNKMCLKRKELSLDIKKKRLVPSN